VCFKPMLRLDPSGTSCSTGGACDDACRNTSQAQLIHTYPPLDVSPMVSWSMSEEQGSRLGAFCVTMTVSFSAK
jgi:hypothetical protein